jgi:hypothetical protein
MNVLSLAPIPMNRSTLEVWRYESDSSAAVHDFHGAYTGTVRIQGPPEAWTGFVQELSTRGGPDVRVEGSVEEGALRIKATVGDAPPVESLFPALEGDQCTDWMGRSPPVPDWPLGH